MKKKEWDMKPLSEEELERVRSGLATLKPDGYAQNPLIGRLLATVDELMERNAKLTIAKRLRAVDDPPERENWETR
jgi:hypothetical protein